MATKPKMKLNLPVTNDIKESLKTNLQNIESRSAAKSDIPIPRTYKKVPYDKLRRSELNDYPIDNLDETVDLLLMYGLMEPLGVNYDEETDTYEIESGDRRYHSLGILFERFENSDLEEDSHARKLYEKNVRYLYINGIDCMVEQGSRGRDSVRERIIIHNETSRPFDPIRTASKINELAQIYTRQNNLLPKEQRFNVNEKIAEKLKNRYSVRQIIRLKNFDNLVDELKDVIVEHNMNTAEISKYHTLTAEEQSVLAQYIREYHVEGQKLELPTMDEIREAVQKLVPSALPTDTENITYGEDTSNVLVEVRPSCAEPGREEEREEEKSSTTISPDIKALEELKATAAQKIKEGKDKKDKKITDTLNAIQKKSEQLEKAIYTYIDNEDAELELNFEQLYEDIDMAIQKLNSIKSALQR